MPSRSFARPKPAIWHRKEDWRFDTPDAVFIMRALQAVAGDDALSLIQRDEAAAAIREHCAWERLVSYAMGPDGVMRRLPKERWNTMAFEEWMKDGFLTPIEVFGTWNPSADQPPFWLFIDRQTLNSVLGASPLAAPSLTVEMEAEQAAQPLILPEGKISRKTHGKTIAKQLLAAAFGDSIPTKDSMQPVQFVALVMKGYNQKRDGKPPSSDTILRVAGWRLDQPPQQ